MSDLTLRELERRWAQEGTVDAEAELIRHRIREGYSERRVRRASHLGYRAAQLLYPGAQVGPDAPTRRRCAMLAAFVFVEDHVDAETLERIAHLWGHPGEDAEEWHELVTLVRPTTLSPHHDGEAWRTLWLPRPLWPACALEEIRRACGLGDRTLQVRLHVRNALLTLTHLCPWLVGHGAPALV